jgi:LAO/AO transport system kinase
LNTASWVENILKGETTALAKAITLLESSLPEDWEAAKALMKALPEPTQPTYRLGFSGPPGVGKSSFIEKLGLALVNQGAKVAVLAVDPSSQVTGGSILGDKTRMELLSRHDKAFVRPSPTRGHLGGVTSSLPGVIQLCEAAGYQWILVESVGVGQSEVELSQMVDIFTLISQPGAGDELQGIKKGILEYVDLILVNKVDRDPQLVNVTRQQFLAALKIMKGKSPQVLGCSALTGAGVDEALQVYQEMLKDFDFKKREDVALFWFESLLLSEFAKRLKREPQLAQKLKECQEAVSKKLMTPIDAVEEFFKTVL